MTQKVSSRSLPPQIRTLRLPAGFSRKSNPSGNECFARSARNVLFRITHVPLQHTKGPSNRGASAGIRLAVTACDRKVSGEQETLLFSSFGSHAGVFRDPVR